MTLQDAGMKPLSENGFLRWLHLMETPGALGDVAAVADRPEQARRRHARPAGAVRRLRARQRAVFFRDADPRQEVRRADRRRRELGRGGAAGAMRRVQWRRCTALSLHPGGPQKIYAAEGERKRGLDGQGLLGLEPVDDDSEEFFVLAEQAEDAQALCRGDGALWPLPRHGEAASSACSASTKNSSLSSSARAVALPVQFAPMGRRERRLQHVARATGVCWRGSRNENGVVSRRTAPAMLVAVRLAGRSATRVGAQPSASNAAGRPFSLTGGDRRATLRCSTSISASTSAAAATPPVRMMPASSPPPARRCEKARNVRERCAWARSVPAFARATAGPTAGDAGRRCSPRPARPPRNDNWPSRTALASALAACSARHVHKRSSVHQVDGVPRRGLRCGR